MLMGSRNSLKNILKLIARDLEVSKAGAPCFGWQYFRGTAITGSYHMFSIVGPRFWGLVVALLVRGLKLAKTTDFAKRVPVTDHPSPKP